MLEYEQGFGISKTKIGVIQSDGTGLRLLTSGEHPDFNPTWTRDGTNMIIFIRYDREPSLKMKIYKISPDGAPGDEILLSDPSFQFDEWASSCLRDGRLCIDRIGDGFRSFLLTPTLGEKGTYEEIQRSTSFQIYAYRLSDGYVQIISLNPGINSMYGNFDRLPI